MTLPEFLLARIAETEQMLTLVADRFEFVGRRLVDAHELIKADAEAKRRIVEHCTAVATCGAYMEPGPEREQYEQEMRDAIGITPAPHLPEEYAAGCDGCASAESVAMSDGWILKYLALPYADHPDYREEWKP